MLCLGIDIGTSGVRSAVLEGDTLVATARAAHPVQQSQNIDATLWWTAVAACLHEQAVSLRAAGHEMQDIARIAVDGTSGSMVLTDSALTPVSPALMYNSKGFEAEAAKIAPHAAPNHITCGSNSALARALRLVGTATAPPTYLLHQADFIAACLMGQGGHSDFNNALKTGFDPETERWPDWIDQVIDPAILPKVHAPGVAIGPLSAEAASTFGFAPTAQIHAGTTDSIAAFLACAPIREGVAVTSLGSTLAIKLLSPARIDDPSIGLYSHRLGDFWLVGGASNTGGAVLKSVFSDAELAALSAQIDPNQQTQLDYYPLLQAGERFPINDPDLPPRMTPRPADDTAYLHGLLDSIARIEAQCYAEIAARGGCTPSAVFTAGGGAQNDVWTAIRAAHLGVKMERPLYAEAAAGAARLAQSG